MDQEQNTPHKSNYQTYNQQVKPKLHGSMSMSIIGNQHQAPKIEANETYRCTPEDDYQEEETGNFMRTQGKNENKNFAYEQSPLAKNYDDCAETDAVK